MRGYRYILFMLTLLISVSMRGQYNPTNPAEPGEYYTLALQATPSGSGSFNVSTTTNCSEGTNVSLRAYANSNFQFVAWEKDGEVISTSASFTYTMPAKNVKLIAHFKYAPSSPSEPEEPNLPVYSTLTLTTSPSNSGYFNISSGNKYEVGASVNLRAYSNSNFTFKNWTENGEVISTNSSFNYVVKAGNPKLVANFTYSPSSPEEPSEPQLYHKLFLKSNPVNGGYFNVTSGNSYQEGSSVNLWAYSNQWYHFKNWTLNGEVVSTSSHFNYTMPTTNVTLEANYTYNYDPSNPEEPSKPTGEKVNIYGMTENGVQGQTITYPVYLENDKLAKGMVVDLQFPEGFGVNTEDVRLSGRSSGHEMNVQPLENNTFRFSLLGDDVFDGNNGKMFEVLVTIPSEAQMGKNYPVILTHGVIHAADGTQSAISVRNGNIYVEKVSEDGLYSKFSFDKLQGRVKFTNLSSSIATGFLWDFGDGTTSTEKSPLHVYQKSGSYVVKLTAKGEVDSDVAEMTVFINDESTWKVDGTFYLSDEEIGVRYFTSTESLFQFIGSSYIAGNVKVSIKADNDFTYPLGIVNLQVLNKIFKSLSSSNHVLTFNKWGNGRNPIINFGDKDAINKEVVNLLVANNSYLECEGVEMKLWNISFNPSSIHKLQSQKIKSGEKTEEIDFSPISTDLTFAWKLQSNPSEVTGFQEIGERVIPSMTIVNEGEGTSLLTYLITGKYKNETFCEFTHEIAVSPALVGLFSNLTPANGTVSESTMVTLTWNSIKNAVYDVYLWNAQNQRPTTPTASGITELRYTSQNFCQNGYTYKWQIVAKNDGQELASDTMTFAVRSLPDLHVYAVDCSEAIAGKKFTVKWTVKNDGVGSTGETRWNDYVWLVTDVYGGTTPSGNSTNNSKILATVQNVKSLETGESYENSVDVTLDERIYGNYYIIVAADMYSVTDIQWSAIGGSVLNPYNPSQDGSTSYKHLYASTSSSYNKVYEQGETSTLSDNFFYKKINIAVPNLADLQIPSITSFVIPNEDPILSAAANARTTGAIVVDGKPKEILTTWEECRVPSPITAAGLRYSNNYYSGKKIAVRVKVANKGGKDTEKSFRTVLYMSSSPDRDAAPLATIGSVTCPTNIVAGKDTTLTFAFYLPYAWHGETYFHAYADIDDAVYELANTVNNWGKSDKVDVLLCPGADLVPAELNVPKSIASSSTFDVTYKVVNKGTGIPLPNNGTFFAGKWKDKVYLSKKDTGLDDTAVLLTTINRTGTFKGPTMQATPRSVLIKPEDFHYEGDNYSNTVSVKPQGLTSGTYYAYVKIDADDDLFEYEGEKNNVICSGAIKFVQPDLSIELLSISEDTLSTDKEIAFTWKLKNIGSGDIQNAKITDAFYATVNQDGTGGELIGKVENTIWITAGAEKTLRANIKIPSNSQLNGLRYIYIKTNCDNALQEETTTNNSSAVVKSWCKYEAVPSPPKVKGVNLYVENLSINKSVKPGEEVTVTYTARNTGDADLAEKEVSQEIFISNDYTFSEAKAQKCEIIAQKGSVKHLKAGKTTTISLTFKMPSSMMGGDKYIHLFADRTNQLGEKVTSDNYGRSSFYLNGNLPDLKVTTYTLADTIKTSTDVILKFTTINQGEWDASKSTAIVYLSSSNNLNGKVKQLTSTAVNAIKKGEQIENTVIFSVPDKDYGKWNVLIRTDANNSVKELDKDNNLVAIPLTILQSPLPDLTIKELSTDEILTSGQPMKIKTTIANIGKSATRSDKWSDTYYLSASTVLNPQTATMIGSKTHVGRLNVNAEYTNEVSLNIPVNMQGNFMLFVVSDASDAITEIDENNNTKSIPVYVNGSVDTPADLAITSINAPSSIKAGDDVTISYQLSNVGEFTANGTLNDVIYLSKNNTWDKDDMMVGVVSGKININPGEKVTRSVTGRITNVPEGNYYVIVKTNSTKTIAESKEDNNTIVAASSSKLSFTTISLGGSANVNTSGYYKLEIPSGYDGKTIGFYLNHPESATAGLYASYETVPSTAKYDVSASANQGTQQELLISNVKAGNYYILAQDNAALVNATGNVFSEFGSGSTTTTNMTLNAQEVNFGATTLSISEGGNGGWVSTDVRGALFDSIMDFRLKLAEKVIPAEAVTFNGMTSSRVTFNLNNAATGAYDVVSELPDGTLATLPKGFKVIPGASVNLGAKIDAPSVVRVGSYAPISVSYANGGNTDCEVYRLMLVIDDGYLGTTIKDLDRHQSVLYLDLGTESNNRGYTSIPPGTQKTINLFMYQTARSSNITIYVVK